MTVSTCIQMETRKDKAEISRHDPDEEENSRTDFLEEPWQAAHLPLIELLKVARLSPVQI